MQILVVEDTPVNQKVATHLLARFGYRADVAASGSEALTALENHDYDLILMDVQMPGMDGLEATRRIRERWPARSVRIVAMTASTGGEEVRRCREAGMDGFLGKPMSVELLAALLRAPGAAVDEPARIGAGVLGDLCGELGRETVREIAGAYLDAIDEAIPALDGGCRVRDRELLARTAHRLRGGAQNLGIRDLGALLADLESRASDADWPELQALVGRIAVERCLARDRVEAELA
ncbi:MAG: response regulator [Sporichthyaceae bacterium]